jgi:hypothetical protein
VSSDTRALGPALGVPRLGRIEHVVGPCGGVVQLERVRDSLQGG